MYVQINPLHGEYKNLSRNNLVNCKFQWRFDNPLESSHQKPKKVHNTGTTDALKAKVSTEARDNNTPNIVRRIVADDSASTDWDIIGNCLRLYTNHQQTAPGNPPATLLTLQ